MLSRDSTALVWFRRDLRLADNPALTAACENAARVLAVYVHAPEEEGDWRPGAATDWWLHHSLARLDIALQRLGAGSLVIRRGAALEELLAVARESGASQVYWNRLYEPARVARDTTVKRELRAQGYTCASFNAALLHEPWEIQTGQGGPYRVFTPFWRACSERLDTLPSPRRAPASIRAPGRRPGSLEIDELGLLPALRWDQGLAAAWTPGEDGAQARLAAFCNGALAHYEDGRNRPDQQGSSRLSPHLHFGEIGPRQCLAAVRLALLGRASARSAADTFARELGWREFAHHLLYHFPHDARTRRSTNASSGSHGSRTPHGSTRGSAAGPATRSSTPACASCGRPAGCTTGCA